MTTATIPTTRPAYLALRGEPCQCPKCSAGQPDDTTGPTIAAASVVLVADREATYTETTTYRRTWNPVMVALATLNTLGTVAAGVALSLLAPTTLGFGLVALCCVGTVIGWQLVD